MRAAWDYHIHGWGGVRLNIMLALLCQVAPFWWYLIRIPLPQMISGLITLPVQTLSCEPFYRSLYVVYTFKCAFFGIFFFTLLSPLFRLASLAHNTLLSELWHRVPCLSIYIYITHKLASPLKHRSSYSSPT